MRGFRIQKPGGKLIELGGIEQIKEEVRAIRFGRFLDNLVATGTYTDGSTQDLAGTVSWLSS